MAAGVNAVVVDVAASTASGIQNIALPSGFGTPKGYIVLATNAEDDGTENAGIAWSYGMSDGTNEAVMASSSEDNVTTSSTAREQVTDGVIMIHHDDDAGVIDGEAKHSAFNTDEIVIDWINSLTSGFRLHFLVLNGDDLSLKVGNATSSGTEDVSTDIDVGFDPDAVIFGTNTNGFGNGSVGRAYYGQFGGAMPGSPIIQGLTAAASEHNLSTATTGISPHNDRVANSWNGNMTSMHRWIDVTAFPTDGFQVTTRNTSSAVVFFYMALASSTNGIFVGPIVSPSSGTGEKETTGIGFKPQMAMISSQLEQDINTFNSTGPDSLSIATGFFDGTNESSYHVVSEDAASPTVCSGRWDSQALFQRNGTRGTEFDAAFVSFESDGWILDYTANNQAGAQWMVFAVEENAAAGTVVQDVVMGPGVIPFAR